MQVSTRIILTVMLLAVSILSRPVASESAAVITLTVNGHTLEAEVADTQATRTLGLAHRSTLPADRGMLFVFAEPAQYAMWMRDTHIPLSVAFLDGEGVVINIEDMQPDTLARHFALRPATFALEVNLGWFSAHGVRPGMRVTGIEGLYTGR
jgi:uncharacterized membrane protein (UPF0127 family)